MPPMTASGLADAITAAQGTAADPSVQAEANLALATAIVEYIQANAEVVGEVTSGAGSGGTVVGTVE